MSPSNLNLGLPFHLGGVSPTVSSLPSYPLQSTAFSGCLGDVLVDNVLLDLASHIGEEKTADGCQAEALANACSSQPCNSSATCVPELSGYRCICQQGRTGDQCEKGESDVTRPSLHKNVQTLPPPTTITKAQKREREALTEVCDCSLSFAIDCNEVLTFHHCSVFRVTAPVILWPRICSL